MMLAVQETGIRQRNPQMISTTPAATEALALALSSGMKLVHFPPANAMRSPAMPVMMDTTTRARAAWRSVLRASMESYTLHCIWPVLWTTQLIQRPSHMVCDVTMLLPMKAVTRHMGEPQVMSTPIQPNRARAQPAICIPMEAIVLYPWASLREYQQLIRCSCAPEADEDWRIEGRENQAARDTLEALPKNTSRAGFFVCGDNKGWSFNYSSGWRRVLCYTRVCLYSFTRKRMNVTENCHIYTCKHQTLRFI